MEEDNAPVVVYQTGQYAVAAMMKSLLDSAGIMCGMLDSSSNTTAGYGTAAIGIRLMVPHGQAKEAAEMIAQAIKDLDAEGG